MSPFQVQSIKPSDPENGRNEVELEDGKGTRVSIPLMPVKTSNE